MFYSKKKKFKAKKLDIKIKDKKIIQKSKDSFKYNKI